MYEEKNNYNANIKLFGIKIYEREDNILTIFEHEFAEDEEQQTALAERVITTRKFFGLPFLKEQHGFDPQDLIPKDEPNYKFKLPPISKLSKSIFISFIIILTSIFLFTAGIYTANTKWFNDTFYIKSRQMDNLEIKSNEASQARYEHYHEYFGKVVNRIRNIEFEETDKNNLNNYLNDYEKRKEVMKYLLFPRIDENANDGGYGTIIESMYPSAMLEFDRQELLTYRMILQNMYSNYYFESINYIFEE